MRARCRHRCEANGRDQARSVCWADSVRRTSLSIADEEIADAEVTALLPGTARKIRSAYASIFNQGRSFKSFTACGRSSGDRISLAIFPICLAIYQRLQTTDLVRMKQAAHHTSSAQRLARKEREMPRLTIGQVSLPFSEPRCRARVNAARRAYKRSSDIASIF